MKYYSEKAVGVLRGNISEHLDWYYHPTGIAPEPVGVEQPVREVSLQEADLSKLAVGEDSPHKSDPQNALIVYKALKQLRPQEAADERLWTYLCHVRCADYVAARWLDKRFWDGDDDEKREIAVRRVCDHFFANGSRAILRSNGLSRLWWLGYIAHRVSEANPSRFLEILLHKQDIRVALIERPSVSMNIEILRAMYKVMEEHWNKEQKESPLFQRNVFRDWMVRVNRKGGVILLDALPSENLNDLLFEEASDAIKTASKAPESR